METKFYHGDVNIDNLARAIASRFNHNNLKSKVHVTGEQRLVQISSLAHASSGGQTSMGITLQNHEDGVTINLGKQDWMGIAASLGKSVLFATLNPLNLFNRLDDIGQDIENINLDDKIWDAIEEIMVTQGYSHQLSEKLRNVGCQYCNSAIPVGAAQCFACGAPTGSLQPVACANCGFVNENNQTRCLNCKKSII
jgi:hypothetical protein